MLSHPSQCIMSIPMAGLVDSVLIYMKDMIHVYIVKKSHLVYVYVRDMSCSAYVMPSHI